MTDSLHVSVLLREALDSLAIVNDGIYIDATYGRGGHSAEILSKLGEHGQLWVFDKDIEAVADARDKYADDPRVTIIHGGFGELERLLSAAGLSDKVNGILIDLGVSSPQLDRAERGFSFMRDGPLDMRMDCSKGESAADWLNRVAEEELAAVIFRYGEDKQARRIAREIVELRAQAPIVSTSDLVKIIEGAVGKPRKKQGKTKHPATQTFHAIRIYINAELAELESVLPQAVTRLQENARLVVISFHSLEDRMVKRFMRDLATPNLPPRNVPVSDVDYQTPLRLIGRAIKPSAQEIDANPRARSSVMRVAERTEFVYAR